ncbi:MAG TPA: HD-GYP domain-containing protein [Gaiellaceae bacterium]|nr:HD-GYP domain-containing protein [Gaiellaceae bacterium]
MLRRSVNETAPTASAVDGSETEESAGSVELRSAHRETIVRLAAALELRSEETGRHVERIARHAERVAAALGLPEARAELIALASPLHDIGKIALPDAILQKPGPLTTEERRLMQTHTKIGHQLLSGSRSDVLQLAADIALSHHERYDGNGYPHGLAGTGISLEARIVTICDVFDALTHDRVYRHAYTLADALTLMRSDRGTRFDPVLFDVFLGTLETTRNGFVQDVPHATAEREKPAAV